MSYDVHTEERDCIRCQCLAFIPLICTECPDTAVGGRNYGDHYCAKCLIEHMNEDHPEVLLTWETQARDAYRAVNGFYPEWDRDVVVNGFLDGDEPEEFGRLRAHADDRFAHGAANQQPVRMAQ